MDFAKIADFSYSDAVIAEDIKQCLMTGKYHPAYRAVLKEYFAPEISRLSLYLNDFNYQCHFIYPHNFDCKLLQNFVVEKLNIKNPRRQKVVVDRLEKELPLNLAAGSVFCVPDNNNKNQIVVLLGEVEDPLSSIYTIAHEFIHVLQEKRLYPEYFNKINRQAWMWRDQGYSEERINSVLKATNFNHEKVSKISRAYAEIQANAGAAVYMMALALKSGDSALIDKVEAFVLAKSASMSDALMNSGCGVAHCDYPVTQQLVGGFRQTGAEMLFDAQGNVDWDKLYKCTSVEAKNLGYTPHMIMDADKNEGAFLRDLSKNYPKRQEMLNVLKWSSEFKNSKILQDYAAAQDYYLSHRQNNLLKTLHSHLAHPLKRSEILFKEMFNDVAGIESFRKICQQKSDYCPIKM